MTSAGPDTKPGAPGQPPNVSVVVGSRVPDAALASCLAALAPQRNGAEVIVCESQASSQDLRDRFDWADFVVAPGALVPELWRDGIDRSRGQVVALTNASMQPAGDWLEAVLHQHTRHDVVAGAIEPDRRLGLGDWAEYFCRYAPDMLPFAARERVDLPGDNASYKRELLASNRELWRDGFWETALHRRLHDDGVALWQSPAPVVRQLASAGPAAFIRQRLAHGRSYGRKRGAGEGTARNLAAVASAPLVAPLMTARILREVLVRRRLRLRVLAALPLMLVFNAAWAVGQARGHFDAVRSA